MGAGWSVTSTHVWGLMVLLRGAEHTTGDQEVCETAGFDNRLCSQSAGLFAPQAVSASLRTQIRRIAVQHSSSMRPVYALALVQTGLVEVYVQSLVSSSSLRRPCRTS